MAKNAAAKKEEVKVEKAAPITISRFGLQEEFNVSWRVNVPMGVTQKDTLKEDYWQHLSNKFKPGDTIIVIPDDMSWRQELQVAEAGKNYAHVHELRFWTFDTMTERDTPPEKYKIQFGGNHHQWRVVLGDRMLKDGFATKGLAGRWAQNHEAAVDR